MNERMKQKPYQFHGIYNDGLPRIRIPGSPSIGHSVSKGFKTGLRGEFNHLVHFGDFQAVF